MMRRRVLAAGLVLALLCGFGTQAAAAPAETQNQTDKLVTADPADYENGQVLVGYQDGSFAVLTYEDDTALAAALTALEQAEDVTLIQPNYAYTDTALSTSDPLAGQQWALSNDGSFRMEEERNDYPVYDDPFEAPAQPGQWTAPGPAARQSYTGASAGSQTTAVAGMDINAEAAWEVYDGGSRDVVVALIDTGVDSSHEDLQNILWQNTDEIAGNGIDDDGNGYIDDVNGWNFYDNNNKLYVSADDDSHGTHGAGTIAATGDNGVGITGIVQSDHVKLMVLKTLGGTDGSGTTASIIQAIQYAQANGASICNLSLGSSANDRALYQVMAASSMLFVVAAGNDGTNTDRTPSYPASYELDNIISVANLNYDGTLHASSNYGASSVDLAAPGSYILSTTPDNSYSYMTGTSMAAPMVTAAAAMVYSQYAQLSLAEVKEVLLASARRLDSLSGKTLTGGTLDLGAAMTYDLSTLSGDSWDTGAAEDTGDPGTAPEIAITTETWGSNTYLKVAVTDADGDLAVTAYAAGTLTAQQFQSGGGRTFTLDSAGTRSFIVTGSGTAVYSFYARDGAGNETVKTVSVTRNSTPRQSTPQQSSPQQSNPQQSSPQQSSPWGGVGRWLSGMPFFPWGR